MDGTLSTDLKRFLRLQNHEQAMFTLCIKQIHGKRAAVVPSWNVRRREVDSYLEEKVGSARGDRKVG